MALSVEKIVENTQTLVDDSKNIQHQVSEALELGEKSMDQF